MDMGFRAHWILISITLWFTMESRASTIENETRCINDRMVQVLLDLGANPKALPRGATGTLNVKGLLTPQRVVFLGKSPGKDGTDFLFQRLSDSDSNPIYRVPQSALRDEGGGALKSRRWIVEPETQVGNTCHGTAVALCVLSLDSDMRKVWKSGDVPLAQETRQKLLQEAIEAVHQNPDPLLTQRDRVAAFLAKRNLASRTLPSSEKNAAELWRHLADGRPAVLSFSAELRPFRNMHYTYEDGVAEIGPEKAGRKPYPAKVIGSMGHSVMATGVIDTAEMGRKVIVLDSASGAVELWPWKDVAAKSGNAMHYQLIGTKPRSIALENMTAISRGYGKAAADRVAHADQAPLTGQQLGDWMKANEGQSHVVVIGSVNRPPILGEVTPGVYEGQTVYSFSPISKDGTKGAPQVFAPGPNDHITPLGMSDAEAAALLAKP